MATSTVTVSFRTKQAHGPKQVVPTPAGGTADVTISITTPTTMTKGDFIEACREAADRLGLI